MEERHMKDKKIRFYLTKIVLIIVFLIPTVMFGKWGVQLIRLQTQDIGFKLFLVVLGGAVIFLSLGFLLLLIGAISMKYKK